MAHIIVEESWETDTPTCATLDALAHDILAALQPNTIKALRFDVMGVCVKGRPLNMYNLSEPDMLAWFDYFLAHGVDVDAQITNYHAVVADKQYDGSWKKPAPAVGDSGFVWSMGAK